MKHVLFIIVFLINSFIAQSQDNGFIGGFQFKPMLGNGVFSNDPVTGNQDSVNIGIQQEFGYAFGMTIRKQFTKILAVESGLRFAQRNYTVNIDSAFADYSSNVPYRIIAYEIPLKGMVRLRGSDNSYFSVSLGAQLDLYPSDVFADNFDWQVQVNRKSWIQGSFVANLGWEIHPVNKGTFYGGFSYNQPFVDPYAANVGPSNSDFATSNIKLNGAYFALDFRYYFEAKKENSRK